MSENDLRIMKLLIELESDGAFASLRDAELVRTIWSEDLVVVVVRATSASFSDLAKLSRKLGEALGKKVRVVESTRDFKKVFAETLSPVPVVGVNLLWLPDGTVQYIVRISRGDERLLPASRRSLEEVLSEIVRGQVQIKAE
ncbi:MAG: transcription elongation factor NusA [Fervidicoccaceae archaeon]